jgi:acetylornithine deacetylase
MRAIAPETGIAIDLLSGIPGLRPEVEGEAERLARRLTGDNGSHVVSYGTEAGIFQDAGWSAIVCGPGDIAQAHSLDEWVSLDQVRAATEVYVDFAARYLCAEFPRGSAHE